jgi:hypothetical protein
MECRADPQGDARVVFALRSRYPGLIARESDGPEGASWLSGAGGEGGWSSVRHRTTPVLQRPHDP